MLAGGAADVSGFAVALVESFEGRRRVATFDNMRKGIEKVVKIKCD